MGEPGTKVTLIMWPYPGIKNMAGRKGEPEWRGMVKIIQLTRARVRTIPEGLSRTGAISKIASVISSVDSGLLNNTVWKSYNGMQIGNRTFSPGYDNHLII